MPVMNGIEATKEILKISPKLNIIAQTAYTSDKDKNEALSAGCEDFISKPIKVENLKRIINSYFIKK